MYKKALASSKIQPSKSNVEESISKMASLSLSDEKALEHSLHLSEESVSSENSSRLSEESVSSVAALHSGDIKEDSLTSSALLYKIPNAHEDDIHGLCVIGDKIVTGSKDTRVKQWSIDGSLVSEIFHNRKSGYKHWVTGLDYFSDASSIMIGCRNGYLRCQAFPPMRKTYYSEIVKPNFILEENKRAPANIKISHKGNYKPRNESRITGLFCRKSAGYKALIGMPELFFELDLNEREPAISRHYRFESPDWVYGFSELNAMRFAVIHAATLSIFSENETGWTKIDELISERRRIHTQRQFISDINRFEGNTWLSVAFFGGVTQVIDIESKQVICSNQEHAERVWKAIPVDDASYITCADDGLIKIWDLRSRSGSVYTYGGHPGRVSALGIINPHMFVAGSCASDPEQDSEKAQLFFYDRRK